MKQDNFIRMPVVAHPEGFGQSSAQESDSLSSNQDTSDSDPVIGEQDLAPIKARVKEYIHRHTRQFHHVYHSSSPSSGNGDEELHKTVWMLKRAQRINSDLWFVQRSLTDEKGVTETQLHTQLLPKLDACLKELDALHSLKREVSRRQVKREVPVSKGRKDNGTVPPKTTMEVNVLSPGHGLRKEPTKKIPSSPTAAHAVRTGPSPRPKTELEKAEGRPVDADGKGCAPKQPRRRRNAFVTDKALKHLAQNDPLAEFDRMQEGIEGIKRYFTLPTVLEPSKTVVSNLRKFKKRRDEELFKGICLTDWELEQEVDKCRTALQTLLKEIQSALRAVVEEFFLVRGPLLGEPNRNLIVVQESFRVLEDLRATFPGAVAEFGKQAGPADGGGVAAPPNSRAESQQPSRQSHSHPDFPFRLKRARADSEEPQDLDMCVKRRKVHEIESQKRTRANSEGSQDVAVCIKRERVRETCW